MNNNTAIAQICLNGDIVNTNCVNHPEKSKSRCPKCNEKTINRCPHCSHPIKGWEDTNIITFKPRRVPNCCDVCDEPYPWIKRALDELMRHIISAENLDDTEKSELVSFIKDGICGRRINFVAEAPFVVLIAKCDDILRNELQKFANKHIVPDPLKQLILRNLP